MSPDHFHHLIFSCARQQYIPNHLLRSLKQQSRTPTQVFTLSVFPPKTKMYSHPLHQSAKLRLRRPRVPLIFSTVLMIHWHPAHRKAHSHLLHPKAHLHPFIPKLHFILTLKIMPHSIETFHRWPSVGERSFLLLGFILHLFSCFESWW